MSQFYEYPQLLRDYMLNNEHTPFIPNTYYDPHIPLPAYRNHEALTTADPRNPFYIPIGDNIENEPALAIKQGIKPHKKQQQHTGVAYTPDYDFDLWAEDYNRPHSPINTYGFLPPEQSQQKPYVLRKQLPQRIRMRRKEFAPANEKLLEFRWKFCVFL